MANEELLKKAVAAFNALSPEQQAEMLEKQRQSWVRGNVGLSRDERGITTPTIPTNTRPAALIEGLAVAFYQVFLQEAWIDCPLSAYTVYSENGEETRKLCDHSQAEAIIAAKVEQERLRFEGDLDKWMKIIGAGITGYQPEAYALMDLACHELVKLRTDNAALTARVKEWTEAKGKCEELVTVGHQYKLNDDWYLSDAPEVLRKSGYELREVVTRENAEAVRAKFVRDAGKHFAKTCMMAEEIEALETQLATARKALEWYANPEIYKQHPHGSAFDNRDVSYVARTALETSHDPH
ncbi:MAG: hypothetical protein WBG82_04965 [Parvibaculum sp.]|uniref:hypothetical protein n=1 Tax=Parvibaculum sp. TaxID=2024848 RepID=UPI003C77B799